METKNIDGWELQLYGYQNHRCLYVPARKHGRAHLLQNVDSSFDFDRVKSCKWTEYDNYDGWQQGLGLYDVDGRLMVCLQSGDQPHLDKNDPQLYDLIDWLLLLGEDLGMEEPSFVSDDYNWTAMYSDDEKHAPFDELLDWFNLIRSKVNENRRKMDILKGKDIYALITDLDLAKLREADLQKEIDRQKSEIAELTKIIKQQKDKMVNMGNEYTDLKSEKDQLSSEREDFKKTVINAVVGAVKII